MTQMATEKRIRELTQMLEPIEADYRRCICGLCDKSWIYQNPHKLNCGEIFCRDCIVGYFTTRINMTGLPIRCFICDHIIYNWEKYEPSTIEITTRVHYEAIRSELHLVSTSRSDDVPQATTSSNQPVPSNDLFEQTVDIAELKHNSEPSPSASDMFRPLTPTPEASQSSPPDLEYLRGLEYLREFEENQAAAESSTKENTHPTNEPSGKHPIKIVSHEGFARTILYTIEWSNGSRTKENAARTESLCPAILHQYRREGRRKSSANYRASKRALSSRKL